MSELLFEIGTEEIPAGYIIPALQFMEQAAREHLGQVSLAFGGARTCGTPRRLTLIVSELQEKQEDRIVEHTGPSRQAGFDKDGNPSKAAIGFARSKGMAVEDLQVVETPKGEYLMAVENVKGLETREILPELLKNLVREIPFPKSMRWGQGSIAFARPIQWLLALCDGQVMEFSVDATSSGLSTRGHRFMAPEWVRITGTEQYINTLRDNWVIVENKERRQRVIDEVKRVVQDQRRFAGAEPVLDDDLVDTVTNLVEIPWGVCGSFDEKFLELPQEVLITSMREHQKYFPVRGSDGNLLPLFVAVNNTRVDDLELAVSGHQRVLRARLEDGLFFFRADRKKRLADRRQDLEGIVFQNKLGSMLEKTNRVVELTRMLARNIDPAVEDNGVRAAKLAKCDLLTEMVGEFPSLQGIMGGEYALIDGENEEVATAVYEHYKPVRAGSELPGRLTGAMVGIADRIDTLAGCFTIGARPTGTTDPFGLRRQALGLLHIILGHNLHLSLQNCIDKALTGYRGNIDVQDNMADQLIDFIRLRFENDIIASGVRIEVVTAATSVRFDDVVDCKARIQSLDNISSREQFSVLAGSFKRIKNIIKDNTETHIDETLLGEGTERQLYQTLVQVQSAIDPLLKRGQYDDALEIMLQMKEPVDRFFDDVMVMTDDLSLRRNRLNLLTALGELVLKVGDISKMHQE